MAGAGEAEAEAVMINTALTVVLCIMLPTYPLIGYGIYRLIMWIDRDNYR